MVKQTLIKTGLMCSLFFASDALSMENYSFTNYIIAINPDDIEGTVSNVLQEIKKVQKSKDAGLILTHNIHPTNQKNKEYIKEIINDFKKYLTESPMLKTKASYGCCFDFKLALVNPTKEESNIKDNLCNSSLEYGLNQIKEFGLNKNYHDENYIKISLGLDKKETQNLLKFVHILSIKKNN